MTIRSNGSYLGPRPAGPSASVASGIWDLRTVAQQTKAEKWPSGPADPDYASVSLLLHMDGANNSTTFTDFSANAFSVIAVGGAKVSTAKSQFGGASLLLDGSGDYLSVPADADFDFGTGDFTIECWVNRNGGKSVASGDLYGDFMFATDVFNSGDMAFGRNGVAWDLTATSPNFQSGWNHIAACRSGTTLRLFCNGEVAATGTNSQSYNVSNFLWIGARTASGQNATNGEPTTEFNGYIDELRITKGVARYTAAFTPATSSFSNYG